MAAFRRVSLHRVRSGLGALLVSALLAGCVASPPSLRANATGAFADNTVAVIDDMIQAAGMARPIPAAAWYDVLLVGFTYVNTRCDAYLEQLFAVNRNAGTTTRALNAANQTTDGVLRLLNIVDPALGIVAQAFGFALSATSIYRDSVLLGRDPNQIRSFVDRTRDTYRREAETHRATFNSQAAVYAGLHGYVSLCLPGTIESQIDRALDQITFTGIAAGATFEIVATGQTRADVLQRAGVPEGGAAPAGAQATVTVTVCATGAQPIQGAVTETERCLIDPVTLRQIQELVCTTATGVFDPATRSALQSYQRGRFQENMPAIWSPSGRIDGYGELTVMRGDIAALGRCDEGLLDAFEVGAFAYYRDPETGGPLQLRRAVQAQLLALPAAKAANMPPEYVADGFVAQTHAGETGIAVDLRGAIAFLRQALDLTGDRLDQALVDKL